MKRPLFFILLFSYSLIPSLAQQNKIDSLKKVLLTAKEDTNKIVCLGELLSEYIHAGNSDSSMFYANEALKLSQKLNSDFFIAESYGGIGLIYKKQGNYNLALKNYYSSLKASEQGAASADPATAKRGKSRISSAYTNIGTVYYEQGNYEKSLETFKAALEIRLQLSDRGDIADAYNNIGIIYRVQGNDEKALENYKASLKIREEIGDKGGVASSYSNIGLIYLERGDIAHALENQLQGLRLFEETGNQYNIANAYNNIGSTYESGQDHENALLFLNKSIALAKQIGALDMEMEAAEGLSETYAGKKDYKKAYEFHQLYTELKDTLLNEENLHQINEMQTKYETEKKDKELIKKDAEITKQNAESAQRATERNAFIIGFVLMILLAVFIFRGYRQKQKANVEISKQKEIIEEKQKEILDSIHYAKRIQQSLLPTEKYILKTLNRLQNK